MTDAADDQHDSEPDDARDNPEAAPVPAPPIFAAPPIFVGRGRAIAELLALLHAGGSFAIRGPLGSGRRTLLRQVHQQAKRGLTRRCDCVLWPSCQSPKALITETARQIHDAIGLQVPLRLIAPRERARAQRTGRVEYRHIHRQFTRETIQSQLDIITATLRDHFACHGSRAKVILFLDHLELPPTTADILLHLSDLGIQFAATLEPNNTRNRIARLLWRFKQIRDIEPLTNREVRRWVELWLDRHPLDFDSDQTKQRFIAAAIRTAAGKPAAVEQILTAAACEDQITKQHLRTIDAEAARVYIDMTPLLIVLAACVLALRYISRGASLEELMILAGVGTSVFWVLLYFIRLMSRKT